MCFIYLGVGNHTMSDLQSASSQFAHSPRYFDNLSELHLSDYFYGYAQARLD